ncbi:hypothetical protein B0T25DRAFT_576286 [Lasiosphaeria hispida]|uniref:Zn(2)-C6 fungal-type domain-containing protein n=1 Tax=Lasiosphaeria hispida TaxID=260671 RepID=A0AAJ0HW89_9PEZI|nr:hypothetical protein B0T25DRAFT_576286 [Lasiosphaeria hispida]
MADFTTPLAQRPRPQKRRRPALACEQCRARKVRCDRAAPCGTCLRSGNPECIYAPLPPPGSKDRRAAVSASTATSAPSSTLPEATSRTDTVLCREPQSSADSVVTPAGGHSSARRPSASSTPTSSAAIIASLECRVHQLENQLRSSRGHAEQSEPPVPVPLPEQREIEKNFVSLRIRGTMSKTRFFGNSHWANGANMVPSKYKALLHLMDRAQHEKTSRIYTGFHKCKALARVIKGRRIPHLPALTIGQNIPDRRIADGLIDGYLRTFETVYRVLHIPSFRAEYGRYWDQPEAASQSFVVIMQLCMAIGACFHDDTHSFRTQATG